MDKIKISVIVPIFNVEKYLRRCLDSIIGQTCPNMEIVLVDDGSTDSSGLICDEYARADDRVIVIHKKNNGLVSARKSGLGKSRGKLVGFVDGDDWIEADYFEKMLHTYDETGADIVASNHFHDIGTDSKKVCNNFQTGIYAKEQLMPKLLYSGCFFEYGLQPHIWSKIFKRDILQRILMLVDDSIVIGEDAAVVYPCALEAEKICVTDICGYHYVQNENSMTKSGVTGEAERYGLLFGHLERFFKRNGVWDVLAPQLEQYKKYLVFMRNMPEFDNKVLTPYGGISKNSKVIIYGAGVLGQKMYRYLSEIEDMDIVLWVDKNYEVYRRKQLNVRKPEDIPGTDNYDYILIANTVQQTADTIRQNLVKTGVEDKKILWFSQEFIAQKS